MASSRAGSAIDCQAAKEAFSFELRSPPSGRQIDDVTILPTDFDGTHFTAVIVYEHNGETDTDSFSFVAIDAAGDTSNVSTATLDNITPTLDRPFINNDADGATAELDEDPVDENGEPSPHQVVLNLRDADSPILQWAIITPPRNGIATLREPPNSGSPTTPEGQNIVLEYLPSSNYPNTREDGFDSVTVQVWDDNEPFRSKAFRIDLTIHPVNDSPEAKGFLNQGSLNEAYQLRMFTVSAQQTWSYQIFHPGRRSRRGPTSMIRRWLEPRLSSGHKTRRPAR